MKETDRSRCEPVMDKRFRRMYPLETLTDKSFTNKVEVRLWRLAAVTCPIDFDARSNIDMHSRQLFFVTRSSDK